MIAFDVVAADGSPDSPTTKQITSAALDEGLVLLSCGVHGNTIRLLFPLVISDDMFAEALGKLERALAGGAPHRYLCA